MNRKRDAVNALSMLFAPLALILALSGCSGADPGKSQPLSFVDPLNPPEAPPVPRETPTTTPKDPAPVALDYFVGPPEMEKYVQKFIDDAKTQGSDVTPGLRRLKLQIQIKSLDAYGKYVIGLCETSSNVRRVTFDPDFWNNVSETQRELVAHHELGHCVLYRDHRYAVLSTGAYASIMFPIIMSSSMYTKNYNYYQSELFSREGQSSIEEPGDEIVTHVCDQDDLMNLTD